MHRLDCLTAKTGDRYLRMVGRLAQTMTSCKAVKLEHNRKGSPTSYLTKYVPRYLTYFPTRSIAAANKLTSLTIRAGEVLATRM